MNRIRIGTIMGVYEDIRMISNGYLLFVISAIVYTIVVLAGVEAILGGEEIIGAAIVSAANVIGGLLFLIGAILIYIGSKDLEKVFHELSGLSLGALLILIAGALSIIFYNTEMNIIALIFLILGFLFLGLRTGKLRSIYIDPGSGPTFIIAGVLLLILLIGAFLLLIGFLVVALNLRKVPKPVESAVKELVTEVRSRLENNESVNIVNLAAEKHVPYIVALEAAYIVAKERNTKIVNGLLTPTPVIH